MTTDEDFRLAAELALLGLNETVEIACWHKEYRFAASDGYLTLNSLDPKQVLCWVINSIDIDVDTFSLYTGKDSNGEPSTYVRSMRWYKAN